MRDTDKIPANDNRTRSPSLTSVNKVTLCGRLHDGPEWRVTRAGRKVLHCLLAHDATAPMAAEPAGNREALHHVVIDEQLSTAAGFPLTKGQRLEVEGQLQTRYSTDDDGNPLILTEIVLAGRYARLALLDGGEIGPSPCRDAM